jgi:hypothetical protein
LCHEECRKHEAEYDSEVFAAIGNQYFQRNAQHRILRARRPRPDDALKHPPIDTEEPARSFSSVVAPLPAEIKTR